MKGCTDMILHHLGHLVLGSLSIIDKHAVVVEALVHHLIRFVVTLHTDVRDKYNRTPLHTSCLNGRKEIVQYLVEVVKCDVGESSY